MAMGSNFVGSMDHEKSTNTYMENALVRVEMNPIDPPHSRSVRVTLMGDFSFENILKNPL